MTQIRYATNYNIPNNHYKWEVLCSIRKYLKEVISHPLDLNFLKG